MMYKYNPVGTTFKDKDITLIVVPQSKNRPICKGCYYTNIRSCVPHGHVCTPYYRKDKRHVIFVKKDE